MRAIKVGLFTVLASLSLLWLLADSPLPQPLAYFPWRRVMVQYSGILAMGAMSVAMVLATRPRWLEDWCGGLDKVYRLHKWLGITALASGSMHWLLARGTKWVVEWGWLTKPVQGGTPASYAGIEALLRTQRTLAKDLGEWTFYLLAALLVLALARRVPYRLFASLHKLLAGAFLVFVFHGVVLMKHAYWNEPVGIALAVLMTAGSVAAALSLGGRIGRRRKAAARIVELDHDAAMDVLRVELEVDQRWSGHRAGQFAFLTTAAGEGAHPFTIASAWDPQLRRIRFIIKALGDHTRRLPSMLKLGDDVVVEGPYGRFTFEHERRRQIWIGAGIGITPFIAALEERKIRRQAAHRIDLFHPTRALSKGAREWLGQAACAAGTRLHVLVDGCDGALDGERLRRNVPDWKEASVWFCGPAAYGDALRRDLVAHGLPATAFHQELFEMR